MRSSILSLEEKLHRFVEKNLFRIGVLLILLCSFFVRYHLAPITVLSGDYNISLLPWVESYRASGIVKGLSQVIGNYYVPYNLFLAVIAQLPGQPWAYIAYLSILCDYLVAWFIYLIARNLMAQWGGEHGSRQPVVAALVTLLLPVSLLNGALWKQCDSVYTLFLVIAVYYSLKKRYGWSFFMLGISFIFKLQSIYLLPAFVLLYLFGEKGLRIFHFMWIPGMYLIGGLPAILSGRRILDTYDCYYHQATNKGFNAMTIGMPNIYALGLSDYPALSMPAILITLCVFIFMALELCQYRKKLSGRNILYICIWCMWACVMFLPAQHERYNYPVILLLTAYYLLFDIRKIWPAVVINLISCFQYGECLFASEQIDFRLQAVAHIAAFAYVTYDVVRQVRQQPVEFTE